MPFDYDLFVIGAGSGGVRASRIAARLGARVAVAEEYRYGGTCVIRGCVPKKLLSYAAHMREEFEDAAGFGWTVPPASHDWATLIANKDREIARLEGIYRGLLSNAGVTLYEGRARIAGANTVEVGGRRITAEHILVATGGRPEMLPVPGIEHAISSNEAFHLAALPRRVAVVGSGYIAVEFAGIFNGLGAQTMLVYRADRPLRGFDEDVRTVLAEEMAKKGVVLRPHTTVERIERLPQGLRLTLGRGEPIEVDAVMYATGRSPNTADLGLESVGVHLNKKGAIAVDEYSHTTAPGIHAVGDVTDRIALTPVALGEGQALATTLFGGRKVAFDHADVASAVFSQPNVATVGLSEERARRERGEIDVYATRFRPLKHTLSGRDERSFMKLVVDRRSDRVLGCHMVGADAPEIIQGLAIAVKMGATKAQFDATVGIHPTAAEEFVTLRDKRPDPQAKAAE
ncbi:MAG: glutathione-disulfide reductase [Thalassobaculales bacterium]